jgi:hypothetical protein
MALYLVFDLQADAQAVANAITAGLGLPVQAENVTTNWNCVRERLDGKWILMWPGRNDLLPPDGPIFTVEEYDPAWFEPVEPI